MFKTCYVLSLISLFVKSGALQSELNEDFFEFKIGLINYVYDLYYVIAKSLVH